MKNFWFVFAAITALLAGCTTDTTEDNTLPQESGATTLTISIQSTRTSLGEKVGENYPVYWSEGDKVAINGVASGEASISKDNRSVATFSVDATLSTPYHITYPYSEGASPKVLFPAEQSYTEGSFAQGYAPMCGYAESQNSDVTLKHLASVLRLPIKASAEGITLDRVVVTSIDGAKIAGEFEVNCTAATIVADANSTNKITYSLPENFALSTSKESIFHITIPAVEVGDCSIEFIEESGKKMTCTWSGKSIKAGVVKEFKGITYKQGTAGTLAPMETEEDYLLVYYPTIEGYVKDTNGQPISGVAVSDGFSVVATNSKGYYKIENVTKDCRYIYISIPSEYVVPTNEFGQPHFYQPYPTNTNRYDFTLTPLAGGKEKKFALFTFGDPQVSAESRYVRFKNEAVPGIKNHYDEVAASGLPCYGITLGDIISNGNSTNSSAYRDEMRDGFSITSVGMPVFQVMGNHDNTFFGSKQPIYADERSSTFELAAQRAHEDMFGPINYSFNRGDTHIIGMRDIVYTVNNTPSSYEEGFLDEQLEWLKQDLALVPKDKNVVLCVHIPLNNRTTNHIQEVLALLNTYKEAHIMSGHTHVINLSYEHKNLGTGYDNVFEHNVGAVCGAWWTSNMCGDGSPCGFGVFIGEGNTFSDWYYTGYHKGMNSRSHQMRLYRGNAVTGAAISGDNTYGTKGYYAFNFAEDILLANVYFADSKWTIKVYEDGVYSGNMTLVPQALRSLLSGMKGDGSFANPFMSAKATSSDMYYTGLALGILGREEGATGTRQGCYHMYQYKLKNKNSKIKVVATDRFGNQYTESKITEGTDYSLTKMAE